MADHKPPADPDPPEESRYECLGRLLGWSSSLHSEIDVVKRLEQGLSVHMLERLRSGLGLTDEEISRLVAPRITLERRTAEGRALSRAQADRVVRIARTVGHAQRVFGRRLPYTMEWMRERQPRLGDRAPLQMLATEAGARAVEEILSGIEHGVLA